MLRSMFKVMAATAAFGVVHSLFASRAAKNLAARTWGERHRNGLYRTFFIAQSVATFGALAIYIRRQPSRELYRIHAPLAVVTGSIQASALLYGLWAARQIGVIRVAGVESLAAWLQDGPVPPEPEAQGPALDERGLQQSAGPFAWSRHPLNLVPLPILWLWPTMTTNLLAFNTAATIYLVIGSVHEEARLRETFGPAYEAYRHSGVPFYLPWPNQSSWATMRSILKSQLFQEESIEGTASPAAPDDGISDDVWALLAAKPR